MNNRLNPQEEQELAWTKKRVKYHNSQAKGIIVWMEQAQNVLKSKMNGAGLKQIFVPLHLKEEFSTQFLFENAKLNKIHSMYCDNYEELPYRPDMAFDVIWRSFEVMSKYYCGEVWGRKDISDVDMFQRISHEVILPILNTESQLEQAFDQLIKSIPESTLRFMVVRLYLNRELGVLPQLGPIKARAIKIISQQMYDDFYANYFTSDNRLLIVDHRRFIRKMRSIFIGEAIELNGVSYKPLDLSDRIELMISCVLYVSRCERYHGDYMSPFKSSMAKQVTYHNFYYLLTITDLFFWIVWYKFADHQKIGHIFNLKDLAACSELRRLNLDTIFPKGK